MTKKLKVALANNFITPYRVPLYTELARYPDWDFLLFISVHMEFDRNWEVRTSHSFEFRKNFCLSYRQKAKHRNENEIQEDRHIHFPIGLLRDLFQFRPDVVITVEMGARSLLAAAYAWMTGTPLVLWHYGTPHSERDIGRARQLLRKILAGFPNAYLGMGLETRQYLTSLGIRSDLIFDAPNAVDMAPYQVAPTEGELQETRTSLGIEGRCFLYVGRLIHKKGVEQLLAAWQDFRRGRAEPATLILVGDGRQKSEFMALAGKLELDDVVFTGFKKPEDLPAIYRAADVFIFPTLDDVWGLVVNEALASGLPVLSSKYAGCTADLIVDGENGWVIDPMDHHDFVRGLKTAWSARGQWQAMGEQGREMVAAVNIERMASGFRQAVQYVLDRAKPLR